MFSASTVYPLYGMRNVEGLGSILEPPAQAGGWPGQRFRYGSWETGIDLQFPSYAEWRYLQPSETQNQGDWFDIKFHLTVPPCLVVTMDYDEGDVDRPDDDELPFVEKDVHRNGLAALRSLRLLRPGWFCDPALTEHITQHSWENGRIVRHLGPYRYAFHDEDAFDGVQPPEPAFELSQRDFETGPRSESRLRELQRMLLHQDEQPVAALEIAQQALTRCAGIGLNWAQRFLLLATGLNAALGDHPVKARALACAVLGDGGGAWLFDHFRRIRNAAAHGRVLEVEEPAAVYAQATGSLRTVLVDQLRFAQAWGQDERQAGTRRFIDDYRADRGVV